MSEPARRPPATLVYRLPGLGAVYANGCELDAWWDDHRTRLEHDEPAAPSEKRARMSRPAVALGAVAVAALGLAFGLVVWTYRGGGPGAGLHADR